MLEDKILHSRLLVKLTWTRKHFKTNSEIFANASDINYRVIDWEVTVKLPESVFSNSISRFVNVASHT